MRSSFYLLLVAMLLAWSAAASPITSCTVNIETSLGTVTPGVNSGSTCQVSTGIGPVSGSALAALALLRAGASSQGSTGPNEFFLGAVSSAVTFQDSFLVSGLKAASVTQTFRVFVDGSLFSSVLPTAQSASLNGTIEATSNFQASFTIGDNHGDGSSNSIKGCTRGALNTVSVCNPDPNPPSTEAIGSVIDIPMTVSNGYVVTITLSLSVGNFARAFNGEGATANASFLNTMGWGGLAGATLPNGDPYTGGITLTSDSGFNYAQAASDSVPEPGTWTMLLAGLGVFWRARRARRSDAGSAAIH